ncbi:MAG: S41 family peptidase [Lachnospiraceae bacterium]|nr:S41 family peptidase [Lachnospiraceae bacterium]
MEKKVKKTREKLSFIRGLLTGLGIVAVIYFVSMALPVGGYAQKPGTLQALRKSKEIQRMIQNYYLDEVDELTQTEYMYLGQVAGLGDEYSTYYTPEQYASYQRKQAGAYMGIGISIALAGEDESEIVIVECQEGYPAAEAGIQVEDVILAVNGEEVEGMTTAEVSTLIQSSENNTVILTLRREGESDSFDISVEMTELEQTYVEGEMLNKTVGYISISQFTGVTSNQFKNTYGELQLQGMEKLILDLRGNPGGLVDSACDTLSQIISSGVLVYTEDKNGKRTERTSDGIGSIEIPLVVLVNADTASSAEIFAGAIQDYQVGTIVGETTYGKGIVQDTYRLSDGSYLKLTVSRYFTPNGHNIHGVGITPDVEVSMDTDSDKDIQLDEALKLIAEL